MPNSGTIGNVGFSETLILCGLEGCKKNFFRFKENIPKLIFMFIYCKTGRKKEKIPFFLPVFRYIICVYYKVYTVLQHLMTQYNIQLFEILFSLPHISSNCNFFYADLIKLFIRFSFSGLFNPLICG